MAFFSPLFSSLAKFQVIQFGLLKTRYIPLVKYTSCILCVLTSQQNTILQASRDSLIVQLVSSNLGPAAEQVSDKNCFLATNFRGCQSEQGMFLEIIIPQDFTVLSDNALWLLLNNQEKLTHSCKQLIQRALWFSVSVKGGQALDPNFGLIEFRNNLFSQLISLKQFKFS